MLALGIEAASFFHRVLMCSGVYVLKFLNTYDSECNNTWEKDIADSPTVVPEAGRKGTP